MAKDQRSLSIVGILWVLVGATLSGVLATFAVRVQAYKSPPDSILGSVELAKNGIDLQRAEFAGWQRVPEGELLYPDDLLASGPRGAILKLESGRQVTMGPNTTVAIVAVGRQSGTHDIQLMLRQGWLKATQPKVCSPCGVMIVVAADASFEALANQPLGVALTNEGKAIKLEPNDTRYAESAPDEKLEIGFLNSEINAYHVSAVEDLTFGREWWTERSSRQIGPTTLRLPIEAPPSRPPPVGWKPFVEVWGNDNLALKQWLYPRKSLRPILQVRLADLMQWASLSEETGVRRYQFHMRGGAEVSGNEGRVKRHMQPGAHSYSVVTLGDVGTVVDQEEGLAIGMDTLRFQSGFGFFPSKGWITPEKAPIKIWLPARMALGSLGPLVRGVTRIGWQRSRFESTEEAAIFLRSGDIVGLLQGEAVTPGGIGLVKKVLRADTTVQARFQDFVRGSAREVAAKVWQPMLDGAPFYVAVAGRIKPLEKKLFSNIGSLEAFIETSKAAIISGQVPLSAF